MDKQTKITHVKELEEKVQKAKAIIFTDYRGLSVEKLGGLRNELRKNGSEYHIVKNTLLNRAITGVKITEGADGQLFIGPTAVAFSNNDPVSAAKIIKNFATENETLKIKGALLGAKVIGKDDVIKLTTLPSREVLIAKLLGSMQSPITGLVRTLAGVPQKFVMTLEAIKQQKEQSK